MTGLRRRSTTDSGAGRILKTDRMRLIATIDQPEVIRAILGSLGIRARPPPLALARPIPQTALDLDFAQEFPPGDFA